MRSDDPAACARQVAGAILAGGAGVRLQGLDKGLQPLGGRPLIGWVIEALRPQVDALLIIANRHLHDYAQHAPVVSDPPGKEDASALRGPLAGIAAALGAIAHDWMVCVPVDCIAPPPDLAMRLLAGAQSAGASAATAHDGARRQPLFALYARSLGPSARAAAANAAAVWRWQDANGAIEVDFSDRHDCFANLNTAEDFAAFERRLDADR